MILSIDGQPGDVSSRVTYLSAGSPAKSDARVGKAMRADDPWAHRTEGQLADLKRRIPILKRLIADCDHLASDLEQEIRNEQDRVKIHDPVHFAYSIYARATAWRRDNLRRSANELRPHLPVAENAVIDFGATWTLERQNKPR